MSSDIIKKIKAAKLSGRGGACFSTAKKWELVKAAPGSQKYIVCNASEGEPGVNKDLNILENHLPELINGIKIALDFFSAKKAFIYLNHDYSKKLQSNITRAIGKRPIELFVKPALSGYIGGEETAAVNAIEGSRVEPRLRPPFPPQHGLYGRPTLIHNVETFYNVHLVSAGTYTDKRFYTINGDCLWTGVYYFSENWTIEQVLKETNNYPDFDFFVQAGGNASGEVLNSGQLSRQVGGCGAITIYSTIKHDPLALIKGWVDFFARESCGQCTPCREGTYRLHELLNDSRPDWQMVADILLAMRESSFCGLGCSAPIPIYSFVNNVWAQSGKNKIKLSAGKAQCICECFS